MTGKLIRGGWVLAPEAIRDGAVLIDGTTIAVSAPFEDGEFKPLPPTGARTLDSRTAFYYAYTLDSPAMIMRIPGVGSQYLMAGTDSTGTSFDGAKTARTVPSSPAAL